MGATITEVLDESNIRNRWRANPLAWRNKGIILSEFKPDATLVAEGHIVIVVEGKTRVAWWRVDSTCFSFFDLILGGFLQISSVSHTAGLPALSVS